MSKHLQRDVTGFQQRSNLKGLKIRGISRRIAAAALMLGVACLSLPGVSEADSAKEISGKAPAISLPTNAGGTDSLAKHAGDVVMLNFWASWCEPCRTEFPLIDALYKKYKKLGFTVLAVNIEPDAKAAQEFLKNTPVSFPVLLDAKNSVSETYKVEAMPTTVMIDRAGNLRYLHRGYQPGYEAEYEKNIRALLRE